MGRPAKLSYEEQLERAEELKSFHEDAVKKQERNIANIKKKQQEAKTKKNRKEQAHAYCCVAPALFEFMPEEIKEWPPEAIGDYLMIGFYRNTKAEKPLGQEIFRVLLTNNDPAEFKKKWDAEKFEKEERAAEKREEARKRANEAFSEN